ncbi:MAG: hypothetical protein ACYTA3_07435 [Planctomycetota bacterium]
MECGRSLTNAPLAGGRSTSTTGRLSSVKWTSCMLPGRRRRQPVLRLQPVITTSLWGRLAMAASIALAFFLAGRILPMREPSSLLSADVELVLLQYAGAGDLDVHRRFRELEEAQYGAVERLLVTRDMTFRDLAGDLANLAADLEM